MDHGLLPSVCFFLLILFYTSISIWSPIKLKSWKTHIKRRQRPQKKHYERMNIFSYYGRKSLAVSCLKFFIAFFPPLSLSLCSFFLFLFLINRYLIMQSYQRQWVIKSAKLCTRCFWLQLMLQLFIYKFFDVVGLCYSCCCYCYWMPTKKKKEKTQIDRLNQECRSFKMFSIDCKFPSIQKYILYWNEFNNFIFSCISKRMFSTWVIKLNISHRLNPASARNAHKIKSKMPYSMPYK